MHHIVSRQSTSENLCGGQYELKPGQSLDLVSSGYPNSYLSNQRCSWIFYANDVETNLQLSCSLFNLPTSKDCSNAFLYVYITPNVRAKFCGSKSPELNSFSNKLKSFVYIYLNSGNGADSNGFRCTVMAFTRNQPNLKIHKPIITTKGTTEKPETFHRLVSKDCNCGRTEGLLSKKHSTRIVGGRDASSMEVPWQVGLVLKGTKNVFCGGTIINSCWILTAAHCTYGIMTRSINFEVLVGGFKLNAISPENRYKPGQVITHELYNDTSTDYDIGLIELAVCINFQRTWVRPACLPTSKFSYENYPATVTGWGRLSFNGVQPNVLQVADIVIYEDSRCREVDTYSITDSMFCAGVPDGTLDACQGDSGGPLVIKDKNSPSFILLGITSYGYKCGVAGYPGVFTKVDYFQEWIMASISNTPGVFCSM